MYETAHRTSVSVVDSRVAQLARSLGELPLAHDFASQMTPKLPVSDEDAFRAYLWTSAVCHATKGGLIGSFGQSKFKGWDFLLRAFSAQAAADASFLAPEHVCSFTADDLRSVLTSHSSDAEVNLTDLSRRA